MGCPFGGGGGGAGRAATSRVQVGLLEKEHAASARRSQLQRDEHLLPHCFPSIARLAAGHQSQQRGVGGGGGGAAGGSQPPLMIAADEWHVIQGLQQEYQQAPPLPEMAPREVRSSKDLQQKTKEERGEREERRRKGRGDQTEPETA